MQSRSIYYKSESDEVKGEESRGKETRERSDGCKKEREERRGRRGEDRTLIFQAAYRSGEHRPPQTVPYLGIRIDQEGVQIRPY